MRSDYIFTLSRCFAYSLWGYSFVQLATEIFKLLTFSCIKLIFSKKRNYDLFEISLPPHTISQYIFMVIIMSMININVPALKKSFDLFEWGTALFSLSDDKLKKSLITTWARIVFERTHRETTFTIYKTDNPPWIESFLLVCCTSCIVTMCHYTHSSRRFSALPAYSKVFLIIIFCTDQRGLTTSLWQRFVYP